MIDRLIHWSIERRVVVFVLTAVFILLGAVASQKVPIDAVPDVTNVQVQIMTPAPSLSPLDVERYVTVPVERAMAGIPNIEEIRSISRSGISVVTLAFNDDAELMLSRQLINERLAEARRNIPEEYGIPQMGPISSGLGEVFHFEVKGDSVPLMKRRSVLEWQIAPRLRLVPNVVDVNTFGGEAKSLELALDPRKLAAAKLGVSEVTAAIDRNHVSAGGAYYADGREMVTVRAEGRIQTAKDLGDVVVDRGDANAAPLYLRDLGEIRDAPIVRYGAVTRDGRKEESVVAVVMMLRGAPSGPTVAAIKEAVADISKSLPEGVTIDPYYDRTELVERTVHTVGVNLLEASLLVIVVLFITLVDFRAGTIVALAIPLALGGAFLGMWLLKVPGNLVSLGAIDFGLVVDGAIIIVENALKLIAERRAMLGRDLTDRERREAVADAAVEVRSATAFGEAIIALVYIPLLALGGIEGRMFRPMAMTVLFALGTAFVISLTFVPALASLLLSRRGIERHSYVVEVARKAYTPVLRGALHWPKLVVGVAVVIFAGSIAGASQMGSEFLPKLDEGTFVGAMVRLPSVSLEQSLSMTRNVEKTLHQFPEVITVVGRTGRAEIAIDPMGMNMTDVYVILKPKKEWTTTHDREELVEILSKTLDEQVPGAQFAWTQPIEMNTNDLLAGFKSAVALHVYGNDLVELHQTADRLTRVIKSIPGAKDVSAEQVAGLDTLTISVDRAAIARAGVDAKAVTDTVAAIAGIDVGEVADGNARFPIRVRLSQDARTDEEVIATIPVRDARGNLVPLGQLARIERAPGPSQVSRSRLQRRITIQANVRGTDIGTFVLAAKTAVEKEKLPVGTYLEWAGEFERLTGAAKQLAVVIPIVLALILVLLALTFGRLGPALLIFVNVPAAISGGIAALALRGLPLSVSAGIGFIALFGVAVLNGLVLVTTIDRLQSSGVEVEQAALRAAASRFRPVITTALVASVGFIPMAIATGAGAEVQRPLATVVIGGLFSSTLLTLLVLPTAHAWLTRGRKPPS
ncbi:MAG: CusA/CzcA family heavy metal efflux RND transporter [Labilithrix sp.]